MGDVPLEPVRTMPLPLMEKIGVSLLLCVAACPGVFLPDSQQVPGGGRSAHRSWEKETALGHPPLWEVFWAGERLVVRFVVRLGCGLGLGGATPLLELLVAPRPPPCLQHRGAETPPPVGSAPASSPTSLAPIFQGLYWARLWGIFPSRLSNPCRE